MVPSYQWLKRPFSPCTTNDIGRQHVMTLRVTLPTHIFFLLQKATCANNGRENIGWFCAGSIHKIKGSNACAEVQITSSSAWFLTSPTHVKGGDVILAWIHLCVAFFFFLTRNLKSFVDTGHTHTKARRITHEPSKATDTNKNAHHIYIVVWK